MRLFSKAHTLADRALDRMVHGTRAAAGCAPDTWTRCVRNGVCSSGHSKERCSVSGGCTVSCSHIGCC
ncbi:hypothetical protein LX16_3752 [Stackebrandtia albiflava]|uniref:Uncharacterized protein n=1 Tax=Stackebrandtia albiflava TaxID=406432 RepID=A0A562V554_9ACTN|nr:hypothetical protein [Stackebrandtia albiflava]TWJ12985.1 hypothetical protein LX16_3752 [Stackebrandtia albiflava]